MKNQIKNFKLSPLKDAKFIKTAKASFNQNGIDKSWELIHSHDSVAILIYHTTKDAFVLVNQFRPAVYLQNKDGMSIELCAGIVDKECSLIEIAKEEIEEECGYAVSTKDISLITSYHSSVGFAGSKQTLYYVEVDETMQISEGGGVDDEQIEVIYLPTSKAKEFIYDKNIVRTTGLMFGFLWWFGRG